MIRLVANQAALIKRAPKVGFTFDGEAVQGHAGETLAAALMRAGHLTLRRAPNDGAPRGAFCCMGLCQECTVRIGGQITEACRTEVTDNLVVDRI